MPTFFHLPVEDRHCPDVPHSHMDLQPVLKESPHYGGVGVATRLREGGHSGNWRDKLGYLFVVFILSKEVV